jgi:hypothetical protein
VRPRTVTSGAFDNSKDYIHFKLLYAGARLLPALLKTTLFILYYPVNPVKNSLGKAN